MFQHLHRTFKGRTCTDMKKHCDDEDDDDDDDDDDDAIS